jgi:hypothetical protein
LLVAFAGVALAGRAGDSPAAVDTARTSTTSAPAPAGSGRVALGPDGTAPGQIVLVQPRLRQTVQDGRIMVSGFVEGGGTRLHVVAIDGHGRVLDRTQLDTRADATGAWLKRHRFAATVDVPNPPLGGTIWLELVAYDERGVAIAAMTRSLGMERGGLAGPLASTAPRLLGEDGGIGVLGVELPAPTPWPPQYWPVGELSWQVNPAQL